MTTKIKFLALAVVLTGLVSCGGQHNTLTTAEQQEGWKLLFDGKTLDNWHAYNQPGVANGNWTVQDGYMYAKGEGDDATGYIITNDEYANFELYWEWKISDGGNSGVIYHVIESPRYSTPYLTGPEYQLLDDLGFPEKVEDSQLCASDYSMYVVDQSKRKILPAGEWNTSKIVFDNGHVEHWLNGEKVIEFEAWSDDWFARKAAGKWANTPEYGLARRGAISFQDHGHEIWFRNVKIKELPNKPKSDVVLFNGTDLKGWQAYGTEKWYVQDGNLVSESGPDKQYGYLATTVYYNDFDLTAEFKQEADGNSGLFFRSTIPQGVEVNGWQVEVAPKGQDTGGIYESYGRGWLVQIPDEKEDVLKENGWNTLRVKVQGDKVTTWLNDVEMANFTDEKIGKAQGRIALQIHDGGGIKVLWRNIKLNEL